MKQLKTLLLATALTLGTLSFSNAQSKIAHINTQDLIMAMPETKAAEAELEKAGKTYEADIKTSVTEFQTLLKQYEAEAASKSEEENKKRGLEIQEKQKRIQDFQADAQKDLQKKQADLFQPITEKARVAILKVARAQSFDYVLDASQGAVLLTDGKNLLDDVKKELGI